MRVEFETTGGWDFFSRLGPAVRIDLGALPEAERTRLLQLVDDARFFELPATVPAARGAGDQVCHITIEYGGRQHKVSAPDPVPGPALQKLINQLRELSKRSA
jgi:hypothetical protein